MSLSLDKSTWKHVAFGDVVRNVNETLRDPEPAGIDRVVAMEHLEPGELKIERWGSLDAGTTFTRRVKPGQTLFGKRRAYQRKVAYAEFDAICSGDILTFEADETQMLAEFLPFLVQSNEFFDHALGTSAGSLSPRTNWRDLSNFEFDLPPLDEQKRIADLLWALERHRQRLNAEESAARRAASALIAHVRETSTGTVSLGSLATVRNGQTFPKRLQGQTAGEIPFFKVSDLDSPGNERWLTSPANWITEAEAKEIGARPLQPGTIVTVRVGAALRMERRRMLRHPALVDENHLIISPTRGDSRFLWAVLTEARLSDSRNDGVVPSLNQTIVGAVDVPAVPDDRAASVGERYLRVHEAADEVAQEEQALRAFRMSLLSSVFGGN